MPLVETRMSLIIYVLFSWDQYTFVFINVMVIAWFVIF